MTSSDTDKGFVSMPEDKQKKMTNMGGQTQGKEGNPASSANDPEKANRAGQKGGTASNRIENL